MRFEFFDGKRRVGSAVWEGPGQIRLEVGIPEESRFLTDYFAGEVTYLSAGFDDGDEFQIRRRDWSPWEFERSCKALARVRNYRVQATPVGPIEEEATA
ncbi:MAG: hypothetical protein ACRDH6_09170 [Actinomycetota bacterium]